MATLEELRQAVQLEKQLLETIKQRKAEVESTEEKAKAHRELLEQELKLNKALEQLLLERLKTEKQNTKELRESLSILQKITQQKEKEKKLYDEAAEDAKKTNEELSKTEKRLGKFSPSAIANSIVNMIKRSTKQLIISLDNAISSFNRISLAGDKYNQTLISLERANYQSGISAETLANSTMNLRNMVSDFSTMSTQASADLIEFVAQLERAGISSQISAQNLQFLTKTLKMTGEQAKKYLGQMVTLSKELGLAPSVIAEQFARSAPQLAMFGKNAINIFNDLAETFKKTGIEVSKLVSFVDGFQNLEGAATAAGRLNAILGGPFVDSMKLLRLSFENPQDAIDYLIGSFGKAGKSLDDMAPAVKKALASILGLQSVDDLTKLFNKNSTEIELNKQNLEKYGMTTEQLRKQNEKNASVQEQLNFLVRSFAVEALIPLIEPLKTIIKWLIDFNQTTKGTISYVIGFALGLKLLNMLLSLGSIFKGLISISAGTSAAGTSAAVSIKPMLALAAVILSIGAAIALAGAGIYLIAEGFTDLFEIIAKNTSKLSPMAEGLLEISGAVVALAGAFTLAGAASIFMGVGAATLALSIGALAVALKFISTADLQAIGQIMDGIGQISQAGTTGMANMKAASNMVTNIVESVDESDIDKVSATTALLQQLRAIQKQSPQTETAPTGEQKIVINATFELDGEVFANKTLEVVNGQWRG